MQMPKLYKAAAVTSFYCNCTSMLIVKDANDFSNLVEFGAFAWYKYIYLQRTALHDVFMYQEKYMTSN